MTHTRQMADDEGMFLNWWREAEGHPGCRRLVTDETMPGAVRLCGAVVQYRVWESNDGGYEDYQFRCANGHTWWIDGIDS